MGMSDPGAAACTEACIDALDDVVLSLAHLPPQALAEALAIHLQCLLATLHGERLCTAEEIRMRLNEIAHDALGAET